MDIGPGKTRRLVPGVRKYASINLQQPTVQEELTGEATAGLGTVGMDGWMGGYSPGKSLLFLIIAKMC